MLLFIFIPGVSASEPISIVGTNIYNLEDCTYFTYTEEQIDNLITTAKAKLTEKGVNADDFNKFNLVVHRWTYGNEINFYLYNDYDIDNNRITFDFTGTPSVPLTVFYQNTNGYIKYSKRNAVDPDKLVYSSFTSSKTNVNISFQYFENNDGSGVYILTNFDLINKSNEVIISQNFNVEPQSYNVTFHLNGGNILDKNIVNDNIVGNKYEDYTTTIQSDKIYEYITNMEFKKDGMDFKGLYYDEKLTLKFNLDQYSEITGDRDFYLKFIYKDVEDFLKNTTFNTYTFNTDYEYAIISLNSKTNKDIYLGLNYIDYSLEIYKYLKEDNNYKQGSVKCLTPYYSKNNKYYYWLESPLDNDYEVLVLPKEKFKDDNYEFLLSNNAYVSYTNDLTKVIIKNDDGQDIETNLENSYNYSQDALLKENNIIEIFKKLAENKDNNVFSYFNQIWNYIKRSKLYTYLYTLIIGSLIILIIHVAKR